jgi:hypothetical protein
MGKVVDAELEVLEAGGEVFDDVELVCYEPWARSTWPLSWGLFGGRTKRRRLRSRHAPSNSALNSDPPSTWIPSMRKAPVQGPSDPVSHRSQLRQVVGSRLARCGVGTLAVGAAVAATAPAAATASKAPKRPAKGPDQKAMDPVPELNLVLVGGLGSGPARAKPAGDVAATSEARDGRRQDDQKKGG